MKLDLDGNLYTIWYSDDDGNRWVPNLRALGHPEDGRPDSYYIQHSQFPTQLNENVLLIVREQVVRGCKHDGEMHPDRGLIDGMKGRTCLECGGYQSCKSDDPWPSEWRFGHSRPLATGSSGYPQELVLAMTRPTELERKRSVERATEAGYEPAVPRAEQRGEVTFIHPDYAAKTGAKVGDTMIARGPGPKLYSLNEASLLAGRACEGCLNVMLWEYGCDDGYPAGSEQHRKAGTSCVLCRPVPTVFAPENADEATSGAPEPEA